MINISIFIIFLGFAGFLLSLYIRHKKTKGEAMVCPLRMDCNSVVDSEYSTFFGIPNEISGMVYYALIAFGYGAKLTLISSPIFGYALFFASAGALLFSLYLTFIQVFTLKKLCSWCLVSAFFCVSIFLLSLSASFQAVLPFLESQREVILMAHVLGMALGLGAATMTDIFFFKFLKDYTISIFERDILKTLSQVIWFALGIVVLTGLALYLPNATALHDKAKFLVKMIVVGIIILNGAVLNLIVEPKILGITFGKKTKQEKGELHKIRKLAFVLGPISIVSWYSAFLLGSLRDITWSFATMLWMYFAIVVMGVLTGSVIEYMYDKKHIRENSDVA